MKPERRHHSERYSDKRYMVQTILYSRISTSISISRVSLESMTTTPPPPIIPRPPIIVPSPVFVPVSMLTYRMTAYVRDSTANYHSNYDPHTPSTKKRHPKPPHSSSLGHLRTRRWGPTTFTAAQETRFEVVRVVRVVGWWWGEDGLVWDGGWAGIWWWSLNMIRLGCRRRGVPSSHSRIIRFPRHRSGLRQSI